MKRRIAIVLCAGYGRRMYPLTKDTPKPLLKVGGRAVLDYLMDELNSLHDLEEIYIVSNSKFYDNFEKWINERKKNEKDIHLLNDGSFTNEDRLGAAGDMLFSFKRAGDFSDVLVAGGDNIFLFPLKPVWERFLHEDNHAVLALRDENRQNLQQTGVLELSESDDVIRLHEKPKDPPSVFFSPPLYFFKRSARTHLSNYMKDSQARDTSGYFVDYLCQKEVIKAVNSEKGRLDIGNMESYQKANHLLTKTGKAG